MLSDRDIRRLLRSGLIRPEPEDHCIQPSSVDLHIGDEFMQLVRSQYKIDLSVRKPEYNSFITDSYTLAPDEFLLARTQEFVDIPDNLSARVEGKSTLGRVGLLVHTTAGFIDPGFRGHITLELKNVGPVPIVLRTGMGIAQICFYTLVSKPLRKYGDDGLKSKYKDSKGVVGARTSA